VVGQFCCKCPINLGCPEQVQKRFLIRLKPGENETVLFALDPDSDSSRSQISDLKFEIRNLILLPHGPQQLIRVDATRDAFENQQSLTSYLQRNGALARGPLALLLALCSQLLRI
jgi:hypothetical protein